MTYSWRADLSYPKREWLVNSVAWLSTNIVLRWQSDPRGVYRVWTALSALGPWQLVPLVPTINASDTSIILPRTTETPFFRVEFTGVSR
jgi:hypothetical protein